MELTNWIHTVTITLALALTLTSGQQLRKRHSTTGCELLSSWSLPCSCRDSFDEEQEQHTFNIAALDCRHESSGELLRNFRSGASAQRVPQIDYLSVEANLTSAPEPEVIARVRVNQLSLTLTIGAQESVVDELERRLGQLIASLCDSRQLQSLTISLTGNSSTTIQLHKLELKLSALERLELSSGGAHVQLSSALTFAPNLKSFSSSGARITMQASSPFEQLIKLEFLALERANLRRFQLNEQLGHQQRQQISSLNLARNQFHSIGSDLFSPGIRAELNRPRTFTKLTQLDLSHNQIAGLSLTEARAILHALPALTHLYLQHNKILHVNLDALLFASIQVTPQQFNSSLGDNRHQSVPEHRENSQLELVDLSHNRIASLTAFQFARQKFSKPEVLRLKLINLAHNQLHQPLSLISSKLINRLVFSETFDVLNTSELAPINWSHLELISLVEADRKRAGSSSICDFMAGSAIDSPNELILDNNYIESISAHHFTGNSCGQLEALRLNNNRVSRIDEGALDSLINLKQVHLAHNQLISLNNSQLFKFNRQVRYLNLAGNRLRHLSRHLLKPLVDLEELYLNDNQLQDDSIGGDLLITNQRLITLDLSNNKLVRLEATQLLANLTSLRSLLLHGNQLKQFIVTSLFTSATSTFKQVTIIRQQAGGKKRNELSSNKKKKSEKLRQARNRKSQLIRRQVVISEDESQVMTGGALVLSSNQLISFESRWFSLGKDCNSSSSDFVRQVEFLLLNDNKLRELSDQTFGLECFASGIQVLDLHSNQLRSINQLTFRHMRSLRLLNLANNSLITIKPRTLPPSLTHFDLSANQITGEQQLINWFHHEGEPLDYLALEYLNLSQNDQLKISDLLETLELCKNSINQLHLNRIASLPETGSKSNNFTQLKLDKLSLQNVGHIDKTLIEKLSQISIGSLSANKHLNSMLVSRQLESNENLIELVLSDSYLTNKQFELMLRQEQVTTNNSTGMIAPLQRLDLSSNLLERWPIVRSDKFQNLRDLQLSENKLSNYLIDQNFTLNMKFEALEVLNVSRNSLIGIISETTNIQSLNQLIANVKQLDFSQNKIAWLPVKLFANLNQLQLLKLNHNRLESFKGFVELQPTTTRFLLDVSFNPELKFDSQLGGAKYVESGKQIEADLVLYKDENSEDLACDSIEHFIRIRETTATEPQDEWLRLVHQQHNSGGQFQESVDNEQELDYLQQIKSSCDQALDSIETINFESIGHLTSLQLVLENKFKNNTHLNLARNGIEHLLEKRSRTLSINGRSLIYLDLSHNELAQVEPDFCSQLHLENLKTLDLSANKLTKFNGLNSPSSLNYLDLSNNKISSIDIEGKQMASLSVLKFNRNQLENLDKNFLNNFANLRHLELRSNRFAQVNKLIDLLNWRAILYNKKPLDNVIIDDENSNFNLAPQFAIESPDEGDESLQIMALSGGANEAQVQVMAASKTVQYFNFDNQSRVSIRFCTLTESESQTICLNSSVHELCFPFKTPPNRSTCMTNLNDNLSLISSTLAPPTMQKREDHAAEAVDQRLNSALEDDADDDLVLSTIDKLKVFWLNVKQFDFGQYLSTISRARSTDSVLFTVGANKYPINTLTLIKFTLILAATCVVLLAIAMFALLTSSLTSKRTRNGKVSPLNNEQHEDQSTSDSPQLPTIATTLSGAGANDGGSSYETTTTSSSELTSNSTKNSINSRPRFASIASGSSSVGSSTTASDQQARNNMEQQQQQHKQLLSANQLLLKQVASLNQQELANQLNNYSSASPSIVETAETMQAVDSLQSSNIHSVTTNSLNEQPTPTNHYHHHLDTSNQSPPAPPPPPPLMLPPVATVMRMVKSNSSNTFNRQQLQLIGLQRTIAQPTTSGQISAYNYGTYRATGNGYYPDQPLNYLNNNQQQQPQIYIPQSMSFVSATSLPQQTNCDHQPYGQHYHYLHAQNLPQSQQQQIQLLVETDGENVVDLDPTTLSLLSINTQCENLKM